MSSLKFHTIQGIATSAALYPIMGENVIPFGLAVIFIDLDHVIEYVRDTKSWEMRGLFAFSKLIEINLNKNYLVLSAFHTIEFFGLILALCAVLPFMKYVFIGLLYHMAADIVHLLRLRQPFARAYSLMEYMYRSRNPEILVSIHELMKNESLNTSGIHDIQHWMRTWTDLRRKNRKEYAN